MGGKVETSLLFKIPSDTILHSINLCGSGDSGVGGLGRKSLVLVSRPVIVPGPGFKIFVFVVRQKLTLRLVRLFQCSRRRSFSIFLNYIILFFRRNKNKK